MLSGLDHGLGETLDLLRATVRDFARAEIAPRAAELDRLNEFPADLWRKLGDLGLLGLTVAEPYGGSGLGYLAHLVAMEELSRASAAVGLSYGAHSNLCVNQLHRHGDEAQRRRFLPRLCSGEAVGALAMSEPEAGSDVMAMRTRAVPDGDGWVLDGTKMWITNGGEADVIVLYARTGGARNGTGGARSGTAGAPGPAAAGDLTAFLVERGTPGLTAGPHLDKLGMRGSNTVQLFLEGCRVRSENVLGGVGQGARVLMSGLDYERTVLAGGPLGIMGACLDLVLPYLHERRQFGRPIGQFELMQGKLADMYAAWQASRAWVYAVGRACDRAGHARSLRKEAAAAILFAAERATWVAGQAIQALGGNGYVNDSPAGRLWRDAKLYEIGAGTSEIRRMLVGRELFEETA